MAISTSHLFLFLSIAAIFAPFSLATNYTVGDAAGWTNSGVNYTEWAQGKTFYVGDVLIFNYPAGDHNVFKVNGSQFQNCTKPSDQTALSTGNDAIVLAKPGRKWYICGIGTHCSESNQKLVITVLDMAPANSPHPGAPPPPSAATKAIASGQFAFVAVVVCILGIMMMA